MADKVDLSLDDIIKMNRKNNNNKNKPNNKSNNTQRLKSLGARSGIVRKGGPKQPTRNQANSPNNKREPTMLHVSNLHYNVSNDDVRELFAEIGPIKKAVVHYDKSGRSLGTAEVTFTTRDAAIRAIKKYHQLPLDGRPMSITLVPNVAHNSPTKSRIGIKPGSGIYKKPQDKKSFGQGPGTKRRTSSTRGPKRSTRSGDNKQQLTAEELDADLEAYAMSK